jgi:hypothetical protein
MVHSVGRATIALALYVAIRIALFLVLLTVASVAAGPLMSLFVLPSMTIGGTIGIWNATIALHSARQNLRDAQHSRKYAHHVALRLRALERRVGGGDDDDEM